MKNQIQRPDEDFPELAHSIRRMVRNTYPRASFEMIQQMSKDHFVDAINDANIQYMVQFKEPTTLDEAVHTAIKLTVRDKKGSKGDGKKPGSFCRSIQPDNNTAAPAVNPVEHSTLANMIMQVQTQVDDLSANMSNINRRTNNGRNKYFDNYQCHHCQKWGHIRQYCPELNSIKKGSPKN